MLYMNMPAEPVVFYRNMNADYFAKKWERLGFRIKTSRDDLGLTQEELGALADVSRGYISKLEAGKKENPSMDILKKLAKALNVPLSYLAEEEFLYGDSTSEDDPPKKASELLQLYEIMPESDQQTLLDLARRLAKSDNPRIIGDQ